MKEHSTEIYPSNVKCVTIHEIAMEKFGFLFTKQIIKKMIADDIVDNIVDSRLMSTPLFDVDTTFAIEVRTSSVPKKVGFPQIVFCRN